MKTIKNIIEHFKDYTFIDWIQSLGGLLLITTPLLLVLLIWINSVIITKLIFTNVILMFIIYILEKGLKSK